MLFNSATNTNKHEYLGTYALYLASFFWGSAFVAQKILVDANIPPFYMIGLRMSFALLLIVIICKKSLHIKTIKKGALMGGIIFLVFSLQTYGLKTIDSSVSSFITSLNLVLIPIINGIFYKYKITFSNVFSITIAIIGVYCFNISSNFTFVWNTGMFLTVLCAIACAIQLIIGSKIMKDEDPLQLAVVQNVFCALYAFIFAFIFEGGIKGFPIQWTFSTLLAITYLGIIASITCFFLLSYGQKIITNTVKVGLIMSLQPIFTIIIAISLLDEQLTIPKLIGMGCIISAIIIDEYKYFK